jgi:CheY-like chemotaxis protein
MGSQTNIMIIDDSYTNRMLLRAVLEEMDIHIIEVCSGIKALKMLSETKPDIILLDMCMPLMNGLDFLKELQSLKENIPVIVVSVLDDQAYINMAYQFGAHDYLIKPLDNNKLLYAISRHTEYGINIH